MYWLTDWKLKGSEWALDITGSWHENYYVIQNLSLSPSLSSTSIHFGYILSRFCAFWNKKQLPPDGLNERECLFSKRVSKVLNRILICLACVMYPPPN